jgi:hypothetical protein
MAFYNCPYILRLEKCAIENAIIQMDVKNIGILGKFLAKKKNAIR